MVCFDAIFVRLTVRLWQKSYLFFLPNLKSFLFQIIRTIHLLSFKDFYLSTFIHYNFIFSNSCLYVICEFLMTVNIWSNLNFILFGLNWPLLTQEFYCFDKKNLLNNLGIPEVSISKFFIENFQKFLSNIFKSFYRKFFKNLYRNFQKFLSKF